MTKRGHQDRLALIERLEQKYSEKIRHQKLYKSQRIMQRSLRTVRGMRIGDGYLGYEAVEAPLYDRQRLAY